MTKSEFVDHVADRAHLTRKQAADAVDAMLGTIEDTLKRGSDVTFSGFDANTLAVTIGTLTTSALGPSYISAGKIQLQILVDRDPGPGCHLVENRPVGGVARQIPA